MSGSLLSHLLDRTTAERDVKRDEIFPLGTTEVQQRLFGREQVARRVEALQIAHGPFVVADSRQRGDLALSQGSALLCGNLVGEVAAAGERIGHFLERRLD